MVEPVFSDRRRPVAGELRVRSGDLDSLGLRFAVEKAEQVIGRSRAADIPLDDMSVSDRHAMIVARDGRHLIYDLGSSNGTFVNDERALQAELQHGDVVRCGDTVFEYRSRDGRESSEPPQELRPAAVEPRAESNLTYEVQATLQPEVPLGPDSRAIAIVPPDRGPHRPTFPPFHQAQVTSLPPDEDEMTTREMLDKLRKLILFFGPYWRSILALVLLGVMGGAASYYMFPPSRRAVFEISLMPSTLENPVSRFERSNIQFFRSAQQNFRSLPLIERTLTKLGFTEIGPDLTTSVQARIVLANIYPNTYNGSFVDGSPEFAVKFLETHVDNYLQSEIDKTLTVIRAEADFLQAQLDQTERDLVRTEADLLEFKKKNIDGLPAQARQYYDYLFQLQRRETEIERELGRINSMAAVDRKRLRTESRTVESEVLNRRPYQQAVVDASRRVAELTSSGLGREHPEVRKARAQLAELEALKAKAAKSTELERRRNPNYSNLEGSLHRLEASARSAFADRARVARERSRIKDVVEKLPDLEAQYAELTRSYDATKTLHTRLFNQLKTTELQLQLERASASARYDIIAPPRLQYVKPLKGLLKRIAMYLALGLVLGLLQAFLRQLKGLLAPETPTSRSLSRLM